MNPSIFFELTRLSRKAKLNILFFQMMHFVLLRFTSRQITWEFLQTAFVKKDSTTYSLVIKVIRRSVCFPHSTVNYDLVEKFSKDRLVSILLR